MRPPAQGRDHADAVGAGREQSRGSYGRWDFVEFSDVFAIEEDYAALVAKFMAKQEAAD